MGLEQPGVVGNIPVRRRGMELDEVYGPSQPKPFRAGRCVTAINQSPILSQTKTMWHLSTGVKGSLRSLVCPGSCRSLWGGCTGGRGLCTGLVTALCLQQVCPRYCCKSHSPGTCRDTSGVELGQGVLQGPVSFGAKLDLLLEELSRFVSALGGMTWLGLGRREGKASEGNQC